MAHEHRKTVVTREGGPATGMMIAAAAIIGVVLLLVLLFAFWGRGAGQPGGDGGPRIEQEIRPRGDGGGGGGGSGSR